MGSTNICWTYFTCIFFLSLPVIDNKFKAFKLFTSMYAFTISCRYETSGNDDYSLQWVKGTRSRAEFLSKSTPKGKHWSSPKRKVWNSPKRSAWTDSPVRGIVSCSNLLICMIATCCQFSSECCFLLLNILEISST